MQKRDHSIASYIKDLKQYPMLADEIVAHKIFESKNGSYNDIPDLDGEIKFLLETNGIDKLYSHQAEAIVKIRKSINTVVATPTASGKTFIYNIPVFESILKDNLTKALYLFPLKALARDQLETISSLTSHIPRNKRPKAVVYDGDTNSYQRRKIREAPPNIVVTNPDMVHLSVLPFHEKWAKFLGDLKFVVIDEVHTFRGVMGSNMSWVIKRLIRICKFYGSSPTFIFLSATIRNPKELCENLTGLDVECVNFSGAPSGKKHFIVMDGQTGASSAVTALLHAAVYRELRTIVYTRSRKMTELISMWVDRKAGKYKDRIASYRAGFLPEERREIEQRLTSGDLLGVVSTSALELGIDIGALDLCILMGYPGSINSTWQRAGRVGRSGREACVIMVGGEDALDQYIINHPDEFFEMEPESAVILPGNNKIAEKHIVCMASEFPISSDEEDFFNNKETILKLVNECSLHESEDSKYFYSPGKYPQRDVSIRGCGNQFKIMDAATNAVIGEIDSARVFHETHPGAVYIHNGEHYFVKDLLETENIVLVEKRNLHYYTRYRSDKDTEILDVYKTRNVFGTVLGFGKIRVTENITGFEKKLIRGQKFIGKEILDLPPVILETEGLWIEIPFEIQNILIDRKMHFMGGIHAVEHSAIGSFPIVVMCDRNDIGGISTTFHPQLKKPAIFIYDGFSGGAGLSRKAYEDFENLLRKTFSIVAECSCDEGCPACIHSPKCGSGNRPLDKASCLEILSFLIKSSGGGEELVNYYRGVIGNPDKKEPEKTKKVESFCVLDIETRRSAAEVGGWLNCHKMGISCVVVYDSRTDDYRTFYEEDIEELVFFLQEFELVIGFNIIKFDYKVLRGHSDFDFSKLNTLDILIKVHSKLNYRLSLDHLGEHTLGSKKSGSGLDALQWWKEGKIEKIVKYCKKDVELTRDLYVHGRDNKFLLFQNKAGNKVKIPVVF